MRVLLLPLVMLLAACKPNVFVTPDVLNTILEECSSNEGIENIIIYGKSNADPSFIKYKVYCKNGYEIKR